MRITTFLPLFVASVLVCNGAQAQYNVGDLVTVTHDDTPITANGKVLDEIGRGIELRVEAVNGEWLWVSRMGTGWISQRHVTTPTNAIDVFTKQIRMNPQDSGAYNARGLVWTTKGEDDIAIGDFNEAIRLAPDHPGAFGNRGKCWLAKGEFDKAISSFGEAIRLDPLDAISYSNRALAWNKKSEFDRAIADATEAIRVAPKYVNAYNHRGYALAAKKEYDKAIADYSEAIRIDSKSGASLRHRARAWTKTQSYDKAISDYGEAIKIDSKDADAIRSRAWCWSAQNEYAKALSDYNDVLKIKPNDAYSLKDIARIHATCPDEKYRDGRKAVAFAKKACELNGEKDAYYIGALAAAYAEVGDFRNAVEWGTKAVTAASPDDKAELQTRLDLFKTGKPYRDRPKK